MDKVDPTPVGARTHADPGLTWTADAQTLLAKMVSAQPVLLQISVAKRLRDRAERDAREAGEDNINAARLQQAHDAVYLGAVS